MSLSSSIIHFMSGIRKIPGESPEDTQSRTLLTGLVFAGSWMILCIAGIYFYFGAEEAGWVELCYAYFALSSWAYLKWLGAHFRAVFLAHNIAILFFPFMSTILMGGFFESGSRGIWTLLGPIAVLVFYKGRFAWSSFGIYLILLVLSFSVFTPSENDIILPQDITSALSIVNIGGLSAFVFILFNAYVKNLWSEQDKTESLILNILPREIAANLKDHRASELIAQHHKSASILFADIVNFTGISQTLNANQLVTLLNQVFCHFDQLAENYGLEKIKTIGDSYMLASGVPSHRTDHAVVLCKMALEMNQFVNEQTFINGIKVRLRIGIHSGDVVAGVIGRKKFVYDLWGNTVNIASRAESQGVSGAINITASTHHQVKDYFQCQTQGMVDLKGLGNHELFLLKAFSS